MTHAARTHSCNASAGASPKQVRLLAAMLDARTPSCSVRLPQPACRSRPFLTSLLPLSAHGKVRRRVYRGAPCRVRRLPPAALQQAAHGTHQGGQCSSIKASWRCPSSPWLPVPVKPAAGTTRAPTCSFPHPRSAAVSPSHCRERQAALWAALWHLQLRARQRM